MNWEMVWFAQAVFDLAVIVYLLAPLFVGAPKSWAHIDPSELPGFLNRTSLGERLALDVRTVVRRWGGKLAAMGKIFAMKEVEYREVVGCES
jgi:hypothetical protein